MLCTPAVSDDSVIDPPPATKVTGAPKFTKPSWNCTVPVGVPDPGGTAATVTFRVIVCPYVDGFTVVLTCAFVCALPIVSWNGASVFKPQASAARIVIVCVPTGAELLIDTTPAGLT